MNEYPIWLWLGFAVFILIMLAIDLGLFSKKVHTPTYKETLTWSVIWVSLALGFNLFVWYDFGTSKAKEFFTGYLIELSLSVDNLFVFLLVFTYFKVKPEVQHRVLFWGVLGALIMRMIMIFVGAELVERFHWIIYLFGFFLIYTGINMLKGGEEEIEPDKSPLVKLITRFIPITHHYEGDKFFTVHKGKKTGTLLLLVLIVIEVTDLVFAVDSIPAIFGITTDRFIVYTSNVFAIMGLRTFYFLLVRVVEKFHLLKYGLAVVLSFIGVKMILPLIVHGVALAKGINDPTHIDAFKHDYGHISIELSLGVIITALTLSIIASLIFPKKEEFHAGIDVTPDTNYVESDFDEQDRER